MRREALLAFVLCCTWTGIHAESRPPGISIQPEYDVFFKAGEAVVMPCVAEAIPNANYTWKMNGIDFNPSGFDDRIVQLTDVGTIVISRTEARDEGIFQCFATNDNGKSATIKINLREAKLMEFRQAPPERYTPQLGATLTLNCIPPDSVPPPEVIWIIKNRLGEFSAIFLDARITMDHEYRLRITNVKQSDNQDNRAYTCMAVNSVVRKNTLGPEHIINTQAGTEVQRPVTLLWASPTNMVGLRGDRFKMKCIFAGNPTPDVSWTAENDRPLPDNATMFSFGQELVFERLEFSDNGSYVCSGTNALSPQRVQRTISIRVESRPYWIEEPKDVEVGIGETARFICLAEATPTPNVLWFINTVPLGEVTDPRIDPQRFKKVSPNEVIFMNVTREDSMVIQCNVTNKHGYIWGDVYLNVIPDSAPIIIVPPAEVAVVAKGQFVNLTCRTTGKPTPLITWFKNGMLITGGRYRTLVNGDLHMENVSLADAGNFRCVAVNKYGSQNASGILMVRRNTQIVQRPVDLMVHAGFDAKFTCSATTDPAEIDNLQIKWMKDNKEIKSNAQRMNINKEDHSLTISGTIVRDSGIYTCIATNGLDNATESAKLTVKDRPDPPMNVAVLTCMQGKAIIQWMPGSSNNAPILSYTVQYNTSYNPKQWINAATINQSQSQKTVADVTLSPYANFTFRVLATNMIGVSDPSFHTRYACRTQPAPPFKHPENVRTIGDKKNYLHIVWTPMSQIEHNGPGFQYILQYKRHGDPDSSTIIRTIDDWRTNSFEYPTADIYRAYEITLTAQNALGDAQPDVRTVLGYSGEDIPTIVPTDLQVTDVGATQANLSWNFDMSVVDQEDTPVRGELKGFKVQVWRRNLRETTMREWSITREQVEEDRVGNHIYVTIKNLLPNTYLEAQVAVMNNFYVGGPTDIVQFLTEQGDGVRSTTVGWKSTSRLEWTSTASWGMVTTHAPTGCVGAVTMCTKPLMTVYKASNGDTEKICPAAEGAVSCLNGLMSCVDQPEFTWARNLIEDELTLPKLCPTLGQFPITSSATTCRNIPLLTGLTLIIGCVLVQNVNK